MAVGSDGTAGVGLRAGRGGAQAEGAVVYRRCGAARGGVELDRRPRGARQRPVGACGGDEPARQHVLAVAVGEEQLNGRLPVDAVVEVAQVAVVPGHPLPVRAPRTDGHPVVGADDEQVRPVVAELLKGLERAPGLHVEEPVDHEDRQVVDVTPEAALAPVAVQGGVRLVVDGDLTQALGNGDE